MGQSSPISYEGDWTRGQKKAISDMYERMGEFYDVPLSKVKMMLGDRLVEIDEEGNEIQSKYKGFAQKQPGGLLASILGSKPQYDTGFSKEYLLPEIIVHELTHTLPIEERLRGMGNIKEFKNLTDKQKYLLDPREVTAHLSQLLGGGGLQKEKWDDFKYYFGEDVLEKTERMLTGG